MAILEAASRLSVTTLIPLSILFVVFSTLCYLAVVYKPTRHPKAPKTYDGGLPIIGAFGFYTKRWDFWREASAHSPSGNFTFNIGRYQAVGLRGNEGRKVFFEQRKLNFNEGYSVLLGKVSDIKSENGDDLLASGRYFSDRLLKMLKRENIRKLLPGLMADIQDLTNGIAAQSPGIMDPFEDIYELVYALTMRTVGAVEISNDPALRLKTLRLFEYIQNSTTMATLLFPWLPSPALIKRYFGGAKLYMIIKNVVTDRQKTGRREDDALQILIDEGDNIEAIVGFIIGALFAGQLNSGINAAWILCYLANEPKWLHEARKEIEGVAERHFPDESNLSLTEKLLRLSMETWESEFPFLDLCLKDSIRLQSLGSGMRRNVSGEEITVGKEIIPNGAFALYHFGDIHQNPNVYPDPEKWDPSRYFPERAEDKNPDYPHAFVGWGTGRHPCLGMRFAKLEINLITAFFVTMFDFELCDKSGKPTGLSPVNQNEHSAAKPIRNMYLKYTLRK